MLTRRFARALLFASIVIVAKIEPYRVDQPIETREALAASMRYLGDLAADLLPQLRARGVVWPLPPRWTRSG